MTATTTKQVRAGSQFPEGAEMPGGFDPLSYKGEARDGNLLPEWERRPWERPYGPKFTSRVVRSGKRR